jgi:hypothetical protein
MTASPFATVRCAGVFSDPMRESQSTTLYFFHDVPLAACGIAFALQCRKRQTTVLPVVTQLTKIMVDNDLPML